MDKEKNNENKFFTQKIPTWQIIAETKDYLSDQIKSGAIKDHEIDEFINKNIDAVQIGKTKIISINFGHEDEDINKIAKVFIDSPQTKIIIPEYFYPEIVGNFQALSINSAFGRLYAGRMQYADKLAKFCEDKDKVIITADIANKPIYMLERELFRLSPIIADNFIETKIPLSLIGTAFSLSNAYQFMTDQGIFDRNKISWYEKFILDFEQARRLFVAKSISLTISEYPEIEQIILMYPRAHGIRILDNLTNPNNNLDKGKESIYKIFGIGLDFSTRQWRWKTNYWQRFSNIKY